MSIDTVDIAHASAEGYNDNVFADGLVGLIKPAVEEIDERVRAVRYNNYC